MYFRVHYITRDFEFGDAQISVSDPAKQIDVLISKRSGDETYPPLEYKQYIRNLGKAGIYYTTYAHRPQSHAQDQ